METPRAASSVASIAIHLAERGVLAADQRHVVDSEIFEPADGRGRREKDAAILKRFEDRIAQRLQSMQARCERQRRDPQKVEREIGRLLGKNTRAAGLFEVEVTPDENGHAKMTWKKIADRRDWATLIQRFDKHVDRHFQAANLHTTA